MIELTLSLSLFFTALYFVYNLLWKAISPIVGIFGNIPLLIGVFYSLVFLIHPLLSSAYRFRAAGRKLGMALDEVSCSASLTPDIIITLVHGTWAGSASWTLPDSSLCQELAKMAPQKFVSFRRFQWSGWNSVSERSRAALGLQESLQDLFVQFPSAQHILIGHSHGGSVILNCLKPEVVKKISGIICLGTPVLVGRDRHLTKAQVGAIRMLTHLLLLSFSMSLLKFTNLPLEPFAVPLLGFSFLIGRWLSEETARRSSSMEIPKDFSFISADKVIFIRAPGDEASAALTSAYLLSLVVRWFAIVPSNVIATVKDRAINAIAQRFPDLKRRSFFYPSSC